MPVIFLASASYCSAIVECKLPLLAKISHLSHIPTDASVGRLVSSPTSQLQFKLFDWDVL